MSTEVIDCYKLVEELSKQANESACLEFKLNKNDPKMIGEDICALANSAALAERDFAYMIWGVDNESHKIKGTHIDFDTQKVGNEELESWLRHQLSRNADFQILTAERNNVKVVVLKISCALGYPVAFENTSYIRVGSYTKKLNDYIEIQARLWDRLRNLDFETQPAISNLDSVTAVQMLDASLLFSETKTPEPSTIDGFVELFLRERLIQRQDDGRYSISNMGAVLFAKKMIDFPRISRKAVRIIQYEGTNRLKMVREIIMEKGYATGFAELIQSIMMLTPAEEPIIGAFRKPMPAYPEISIRELVANALIHQDLSIKGAGPLIEIFADRIEISNPGACLVEADRIIDCVPRSRNEDVAALMRRLHICEEAGGGWDKAVSGCEEKHIPAPKVEANKENVRVTLSIISDFAKMTTAEKLWTCYLHACLMYVENQYLTNTSLRARFGLKDESAASISRLIKDALAQGMIKPHDPETAKRYMKYVPIWA